MAQEKDFYQVYELGEGIYHIWEPMGVASTLVQGTDACLLIDTGYGFADLKRRTEAITSLPRLIVNTHCHLDHAGGNFRFREPVYANPEELEVYEHYQRVQKRLVVEKCLRERKPEELPWPDDLDLEDYLRYMPCEFLPLKDGMAFDLGGRRVRTIFLPGHTRGSAMFFDEKTGTLFSGDNISNSLWIQFEYSEDVKQFACHLDRLKEYPITRIVSSHRKSPWPVSIIGLLQEAIRHITPEESRVFIHPRTGVESRLFKYPIPETSGADKIFIVYDHHRFP